MHRLGQVAHSSAARLPRWSLMIRLALGPSFSSVSSSRGSAVYSQRTSGRFALHISQSITTASRAAPRPPRDPRTNWIMSEFLLKHMAGLSAPMVKLTGVLLKPFKGSPNKTVAPKGAPAHPPTPRAEMEEALRALDASKASWLDVSLEERARLLQQCADNAVEVQREMGAVEARLKGTYESGIGEHLLNMVGVLFGIAEMKATIEAGGQPSVGPARQVGPDQQAVEVFPRGLDHILFAGFRGEIWLQPGKPATQGAAVRQRRADGGGVCLCLAAGNQISVAGLDIIHALFHDSSVVVCKMSEVNEACGPLLAKVFAPLVARGVLRFIYGGPEEGKFLTAHPLVSSIHITGSDKTHDAIVWGPGAPKKGTPKCSKKITSELGCASPVIITPGQWSSSDLDYQARQVASAVVHNASHNCVAAEVVITARGWPQRAAFLARLRHHLQVASPRASYYPGTQAKYDAYRQAMPTAEEMSSPESLREMASEVQASWEGGAARAPPVVPWVLAEGCTLEAAGPVMMRENWCGVLTEVALEDVEDPEAFLAAAVEVANDKCWGSLSCSIVVHPSTRARHPAAVDAAVAGLKYGGICVNGPGLAVFGATRLPWGAFPGNTIEDVGSGIGFVHNTMMLDHPQKGVLWLPWEVHPTPWWMYDHRNLEGFALAAAQYCRSPGVGTLLPLANAGLMG